MGTCVAGSCIHFLEPAHTHGLCLLCTMHLPDHSHAWGACWCRGLWWKLPLALGVAAAAGTAGYHFSKKFIDERKKKK